jgi:hypothetical protein
MPLLVKKARENLATKFGAKQVEDIMNLLLDRGRLETTSVQEWMNGVVAR